MHENRQYILRFKSLRTHIHTVYYSKHYTERKTQLKNHLILINNRKHIKKREQVPIVKKSKNGKTTRKKILRDSQLVFQNNGTFYIILTIYIETYNVGKDIPLLKSLTFTKTIQLNFFTFSF